MFVCVSILMILWCLPTRLNCNFRRCLWFTLRRVISYSIHCTAVCNPPCTEEECIRTYFYGLMFTLCYRNLIHNAQRILLQTTQ